MTYSCWYWCGLYRNDLVPKCDEPELSRYRECGHGWVVFSIYSLWRQNGDVEDRVLHDDWTMAL